ncbi:MAG: PilZ domain-containing protein [Zetaproteobacteria bacterium]|nr:PilZ domain-containing protein [Zetaproteobacteria bacterium]
MTNDDGLSYNELDDAERERIAREARRHARFKPDTFVKSSGKLYACSDGRLVEFELKDYSKSGMGISSRDQILPDIEFSFRIGSHEVLIQLVWGMEIAGETEKKRYGFRLQNSEQNLEEIVTAFVEQSKPTEPAS